MPVISLLNLIIFNQYILLYYILLTFNSVRTNYQPHETKVIK